MTENLITKKCYCGNSFETVSQKIGWLEEQDCPSCKEKVTAEVTERDKIRQEQEAQEEAARIEARVVKIKEAIDDETPSRFQATDTTDQRFNRALWEQVTNWLPTAEKPWLGLVGEAGACKTRIAYLRLRQIGEEWTRQHKRVAKIAAVTGPEFKRYALDRFSKETIQSTHWNSTGDIAVSEIAASNLRRIKNADVLLFDELGEKIKATPAVIEELFGLIDYRHSENLVTIWTCNSSPEEFCGGWPPEFAGPIAGRIVESSTIFKA